MGTGEGGTEERLTASRHCCATLRSNLGFRHRQRCAPSAHQGARQLADPSSRHDDLAVLRAVAARRQHRLPRL